MNLRERLELWAHTDHAGFRPKSAPEMLDLVRPVIEAAENLFKQRNRIFTNLGKLEEELADLDKKLGDV